MIVRHEDELGIIDTLAVGDVLSVVGVLDVHVEEDRQRRRRVAFSIIAKQFLLLRHRSRAKAAATSFLEPPMAGGFVRPMASRAGRRHSADQRRGVEARALGWLFRQKLGKLSKGF